MVLPLPKKQRKKMVKKVATGAADFMRKNFRVKTPAEKQAFRASQARKRVKALVQHLTPAKRKAAIKNLQAKKAARAKAKANKT
jgi:hypothetical protein